MYACVCVWVKLLCATEIIYIKIHLTNYIELPK